MLHPLRHTPGCPDCLLHASLLQLNLIIHPDSAATGGESTPLLVLQSHCPTSLPLHSLPSPPPRPGAARIQVFVGDLAAEVTDASLFAAFSGYPSLWCDPCCSEPPSIPAPQGPVLCQYDGGPCFANVYGITMHRSILQALVPFSSSALFAWVFSFIGRSFGFGFGFFAPFKKFSLGCGKGAITATPLHDCSACSELATSPLS